MNEARAGHATKDVPSPSPAELVRPITEWLERNVAPLIAHGEQAQVTFDIAGGSIKAKLTIAQKIT